MHVQQTITALLLLFPNPVYAVAWGDCVDGAPKLSCIVPLFRNVVTGIMGFVGFVLFIMLIVAGFSFLLSGGDPKKLEQAKNTLTYAVIGIVVIVLSYLILLAVEKFTGVTVTQFNPQFE